MKNSVWKPVSNKTSIWNSKLPKLSNKLKLPKIKQSKFRVGMPVYLFGDKDRDRVANVFDCKPRNPRKQGWVHTGAGFVYYPEIKVSQKMMTPDKFLRTTHREVSDREKRTLKSWQAEDEKHDAKYVPSKELLDSRQRRYAKMSHIAYRNMKEYSQQVINKDNVEKLKKVIKSKEGKMNIPYLQYDEQGRPKGHEGRHRAPAAKQLGVKLIPVTIVKEKKMSEELIDEIKGMPKEEYDKLVKDTIEVQSTKSADVPIEEQQKYGEESPETLQSLNGTDIEESPEEDD